MAKYLEAWHGPRRTTDTAGSAEDEMHELSILRTPLTQSGSCWLCTRNCRVFELGVFKFNACKLITCGKKVGIGGATLIHW